MYLHVNRSKHRDANTQRDICVNREIESLKYIDTFGNINPILKYIDI